MEELLRMLAADEEYRSLRKEWKDKMDKPFPLFNTVQYAGITDYKEK